VDLVATILIREGELIRCMRLNWYMSYFLSWSDASRTLKNQGVLRGNLRR
jgi:hypothetical protein